MNKKKISLENLKVKSFITSIESNFESIRGGGKSINEDRSDGNDCPQDYTDACTAPADYETNNVNCITHNDYCNAQ